MRSAGNDIVAFDQTDPARNKLPGFYEKILTPAEVSLYHTFPSPDLSFHAYLWLCWSVKESVYKYAARTRPGLVFGPTRIVVKAFLIMAEKQVDVKAIVHTTIQADNLTYYGKSFLKESGVCTIVHDEDHFKGVYWGWEEGRGIDPSEAVRSLVVRDLGGLFPDRSWTVRKHREGYPVLESSDGELEIPVSFAHHGSSVGYSFFVDTLLGAL